MDYIFKTFFICLFFQFNYSNHQSDTSIIIVFFFNGFFFLMFNYLLAYVRYIQYLSKENKSSFFSLKTNKCLCSSLRTQKDVDRIDLYVSCIIDVNTAFRKANARVCLVNYDCYTEVQFLHVCV